MIKSEKGDVIIEGEVNAIYADLACLFQAMRKVEYLDIDKIVNDALEDSKKSREEMLTEVCGDKNKIVALLKEFIADLGKEK